MNDHHGLVLRGISDALMITSHSHSPSHSHDWKVILVKDALAACTSKRKSDSWCLDLVIALNKKSRGRWFQGGLFYSSSWPFSLLSLLILPPAHLHSTAPNREEANEGKAPSPAPPPLLAQSLTKRDFLAPSDQWWFISWEGDGTTFLNT